MQTGIVSSENLAEILREVSQKRRHGVLEIIFPDETVAISFVSGKIVEYSTNLETPATDLGLRLQLCGLQQNSSKLSVNSYQELYDLISQHSTNNIDQDFFKLLVRERILEHLYKLQLGAGVYYNFKVQMVKAEEFNPSISVGQLLLDLVALKEEGELFNKQFSNEVILKASAGIKPEDPSEKWLSAYLGTPRRIVDILNIQPFSILKFQELVTNMFQRRELELADTMEAGDINASAMLDDIVSALEGALDSSSLPFTSKSDEQPDISVLEEALTTNNIATKVESKLNPENLNSDKKQYLQMLNAELLQKSLVPNILSLFFLLAAIYAPFIVWKQIIEIFSEF